MEGTTKHFSAFVNNVFVFFDVEKVCVSVKPHNNIMEIRSLCDYIMLHSQCENEKWDAHINSQT